MATNYKLQTTNCSRGFTAIEILIVVFILGLLSAIIISSFSAFRKQSLLSTETQEIITTINKARLSSMSSKSDQQYGVHLQSTKIVLFQGTTYATSSSSNETHIFDPLVTLGTITINGGGADIVFQKITGGTTQYATTTLSVVGSSTASSTILIRGTGVVTVK